MQQEQNYDPRVTGQQGGLKRAERLSAEQRRIISSIAARTRWHPEKMQAAREQAARIKRIVDEALLESGHFKGLCNAQCSRI